MRYPPQPFSITTESIHDLYMYWLNNLIPFGWKSLFLIPPWLKAWDTAFSEGDSTSEITVFRTDNRIIGVVPLLVKDKRASIIGSPNVCDYTGLIVTPGNESNILLSLFTYLSSRGIDTFTFYGIREDDSMYMQFIEMSRDTRRESIVTLLDVSFETMLPATWLEYLDALSGKQRHEIRRKMRRLTESGDIALRIIENPGEVSSVYDDFLRLFLAGRKEKADFMNPEMATFFSSLMIDMAESGLLRLYFLDINKIPVATALCFEYDNTMFLYNSGYDPQFSSLSVGLMCKALSIQNAIERGCKTYDFLKGQEPYKQRLGGAPVSVMQMEFDLRTV